MKNSEVHLAGLIILVIIFGLFMLGFSVGISKKDRLEKEAISLGLAEYNSTNACFQWKTNLIDPKVLYYNK